MARKAPLLILSVLLLALSSASLITLAQPTNSTEGPHALAQPTNNTEGPAVPPPGDKHSMEPCLTKFIRGHPCPTNQDPNGRSFGHMPSPPPIRQRMLSSGGASHHNFVPEVPVNDRCRYCSSCC